MKYYIVDTNILIDIKKIMLNERDSNKNRDRRNYEELIDYLTNGEIGIIVTPTVLQEIKKGSYKDDFLLERFINRFCEVCEFSEKENELIEDLYNDYIDGEDPAVPVFKNMGDYMKYNDNDAKVLAEATVLYNNGKYDVIKMLTKNIKDFINMEKTDKINKKYGLKTIQFNSMKATNVKNERR